MYLFYLFQKLDIYPQSEILSIKSVLSQYNPIKTTYSDLISLTNKINSLFHTIEMKHKTINTLNNEILKMENKVLCLNRNINKGIKVENVNYVILLYNKTMNKELENSLNVVYIIYIQ